MSKVMIVDDMAIFRDPIAAALKQEGFEVCRAANGVEALDQVKRETPDLILLDIAMPEMDGMTFLETIRKNEQWYELPVILLTAVNDKSYILRARDLNAQEYLVKSYFSLDELIKYVRKYTDVPNIKAKAPDKSEEPKQKKASKPFKPINPISEQECASRIANQRTITPLSEVIRKVVQSTASPNVNRLDLAALIAQDPVLTSRTLQLANTAAYATTGNRTVSIDEAIVRIGFDRVRDVATTVGIVDSYSSDSETRIDILRHTEHCLAVATLMARVPYLDMQTKTLGYTLGLCHDLTNIVIRQEFPDHFAQAIDIALASDTEFTSVLERFLGIPYERLVAVTLSGIGLPHAIIKPAIDHFNCQNGKLDFNNLPSHLAMALNLTNLYCIAHCFTPSTAYTIRPVAKLEHRRVYGELSISIGDVESALQGIRPTVISLARLSAKSEKLLRRQLFPKKTLKLCYIRDDYYSAVDPLQMALSSMVDIQVLNSLSEADPLLSDCDGLVVATPILDTSSALYKAAISLVNKPGLATFHLAFVTAENSLSRSALPAHVDVMTYPLSLARLGEYLTAVECHKKKKELGDANQTLV
ncbi:MAG: response regulator [Deltaproteobacteria bacterium]|nr:response regulator [Deltaproteobacteria bacterium]